jgi:hypothetical protein
MADRILVYQMGKVGSVAWLRAIEAACPDANVHHMHFLSPAATRRIHESIARRGDTQTFVNIPMLRRDVDRSGLQDKVVEGRWCGGPALIVSGMRDPIDRAASLLFFFADFYGNAAMKLSFREGATAETLTRYFIDSWEKALSGDFGTATFDQRLRRAFVRYQDWFATEIAGVFGPDIAQERFDPATGCLVARGGDGIGVFCYRFEDLRESAWPSVAASASGFLQAPIGTLPVVNATTRRRSKALYEAFKAELAMPTDLIEAIYAAPVVRLFYSPDEIGRFRARWTGAEPQAASSGPRSASDGFHSP